MKRGKTGKQVLITMQPNYSNQLEKELRNQARKTIKKLNDTTTEKEVITSKVLGKTYTLACKTFYHYCRSYEKSQSSTKVLFGEIRL